MDPSIPPESAPLEVDRVEWVPASPEAVAVHVFGRWRESPVADPLSLVVRVGDRHDTFAAGEAPPDGVLLAFSVPVELRLALTRDLALRIGSGEMALPAATVGRVRPVEEVGDAEVIDRTELLERRARRAELSTESLQRRAEEAEETSATLETQLAHLESRLDAVQAERLELDAAIADAERRVRAAEEREYAEQHQRVQLQADLARLQETTDAEIADLRRRLSVAHERAEELAQQVDEARRVAAAAAPPEKLQALADERDAAQARAALLEHEMGRRETVHERMAADLAEAQARLSGPAVPAAASGPPTSGVAEQLVAILARQLERASREAERAREDLARERLATPAVSPRPAESSELMVIAQQIDAIERHVSALRDELASAVATLRTDLESERARGDRLAIELARLRDDFAASRTQEADTTARTEALVADLAVAAERLREQARPIEDEDEPEPSADEPEPVAEEPVAQEPEPEPSAEEPEPEPAAEEPEPEPAAEEPEPEPAAEEPEPEPVAEEPEPEPVAEEPEPEPVAEEPEPAAEPEAEPETEAPPAQEPEPELETGPALTLETIPEPDPDPSPEVYDALIVTEPEPDPNAIDIAAGAEAPRPGAILATEQGPRRTAPWLAGAIRALAASDAEAAANLVVAVLPAQRFAVDREYSYGISLENVGTYKVRLSPGPRVGEKPDTGRVDFHLSGKVAAFADFAGGGGSGNRLRGVRITGSKWRARRLARSLKRPVQLAHLTGCNVTLDPSLLLVALCSQIDPRWTIGTQFVVGWDIAGGHGGRCHVRVLNGLTPTVGDGIPDDATATVHVSDAGLIALLGGERLREGEEARVEGDPDPVARLRKWFDVVQGAPGASA